MYDINYDDLDIERLRDDLKDDFGTGAYAVNPAMMMEVFDLDNATDEEVVAKALNMHYDLNKYRKDRYVR